MFNNIKSSLALIKEKPVYMWIGLTESLLFSILQIFIFIWTPILKQKNPEVETSEVFTLFMMALMVGGAFFRVNIYLYRLFSYTLIMIPFQLLN
jgi:hypothetical protein